MIGDIVKIRTPYFDSKSNSIRFKSRPGLIIGNYGPTDSDYLVLPISKISHSRFRHPTYDLLIDPQTYPLSNLTCRSYIRCHKQVTIRRADISDTISKFKVNYPEKYSEVIELLSKFDKEKSKMLNNIIYRRFINMEQTHEIEIQGCIEAPIDLLVDDFTDLFIKFIESHNCYFGGGINEYKED